MIGVVTKSTGLWYEVLAEGKSRIARLRGKFKLDDRKLTNPIAVGDEVVLKKNKHAANEWVITKICDRKNYVIRTSPKKTEHHHLLASNIDQGVLIVTLKSPRTSIGFIDRFLITLEAFRIPAIIIFNKQDLFTAKLESQYNVLKQRYGDLGYKVTAASFLNADRSSFLSYFQDRKSLLAGHSGAGKSTLVNLLYPDVQQEVREISSFADKGVHTTTFAEMFYLDQNTAIIDTPGIKEMGLSEIEREELSHYFPEMRAYLGHCKFNNCVHENEPHCRIKEEVGRKISVERYESYLSILNTSDNRR
ncbi:MAG: ribosome small subunit-dependent GTPase A [Bacteroidota bacterium]